eukprot:scaffold2260_cov134-Isochrysis_galbana.AAC.3
MVHDAPCLCCAVCPPGHAECPTCVTPSPNLARLGGTFLRGQHCCPGGRGSHGGRRRRRGGVQQDGADHQAGAEQHRAIRGRTEVEDGGEEAREQDGSGRGEALPDVVGVLDYHRHQQPADACGSRCA